METIIKYLILLLSVGTSFFFLYFLIDYLQRSSAEKNKLKQELKQKKEAELRKQPNFKEVDVSRGTFFAKLTDKQFLLLKFASTAVIFFFLTFVVQKWFFGIAFGIFGFFIPNILRRYLHGKWVLTLELQLVDALTIVANALKAGMSFPQALGVMIQESADPIKSEFETVVQEARIGVPMEEALENLKNRIPSPDYDILVTSVIVSRKAGGNLSEVLKTIAETIRNRQKIRGKIDALTAQGKMSGVVVAILPFGLAFAINKVDPELMKPMFTTIIGYALFLVIFIMEGVAAYWIYKIVDIDI